MRMSMFYSPLVFTLVFLCWYTDCTPEEVVESEGLVCYAEELPDEKLSITVKNASNEKMVYRDYKGVFMETIYTFRDGQITTYVVKDYRDVMLHGMIKPSFVHLMPNCSKTYVIDWSELIKLATYPPQDFYLNAKRYDLENSKFTDIVAATDLPTIGIQTYIIGVKVDRTQEEPTTTRVIYPIKQKKVEL